MSYSIVPVVLVQSGVCMETFNIAAWVSRIVYNTQQVLGVLFYCINLVNVSCASLWCVDNFPYVSVT